MRTCDDCQFYCTKQPKRLYGECRLKPPAPITTTSSQDHWRAWPRVYNHDWCGEWLARLDDDHELHNS